MKTINHLVKSWTYSFQDRNQRMVGGWGVIGLDPFTSTLIISLQNYYALDWVCPLLAVIELLMNYIFFYADNPYLWLADWNYTLYFTMGCIIRLGSKIPGKVFRNLSRILSVLPWSWNLAIGLRKVNMCPMGLTDVLIIWPVEPGV